MLVTVTEVTIYAREEKKREKRSSKILDLLVLEYFIFSGNNEILRIFEPVSNEKNWQEDEI